MKKNGFTLIELLAVIVILAIIALIATPIILGIINDSKRESNKRSIDMYANAIKQAAARYQMNSSTNEYLFGEFTTTDGKTLTHESEKILNVDYDGSKVVCSTILINKDGSIYLADCTVDDTSVTGYTYGRPVYKPQYYFWGETRIGADLPKSAKEKAFETSGYSTSIYFGIDVDSNNKVTAVYACFVRKGTEYCLKYTNDASSQNLNSAIIKYAYSDVINDTTYCSFSDNNAKCMIEGLTISSTKGVPSVKNGSASCAYYNSSYYSCDIWF